MAFKDRRRNDVRDNIQGRTVWITSAEINIADVGAGTTVLFSFPKANETYIIDKCALDVLTDLDAGTVTIGHGSLPLDTTAESGTLTTTSATSLWDTDNGDETTGTIFNIDEKLPSSLLVRPPLSRLSSLLSQPQLPVVSEYICESLPSRLTVDFVKISRI